MIARVHKGLQGITRVYKGSGLQRYCFQGVIRVYNGLQGITRVYKRLQGIMGIQGFTMDCKGNTRDRLSQSPFLWE